jgi:hypothetical protein
VLSPAAASSLARIALGHVTREYPNKPEHTLERPEDARTPSALHPVFYGSFDWHSCVHSYWLLARVLRRCPDVAEAGAIAALFDRQLVPEKVAGECAYLRRGTARGFKRPYGWGWLLKLADELRRLPAPGWAAALDPLARIFADRFREFLPLAALPVRAGTHGNTAFGLRMAADWAEGSGDAVLLALLVGAAERWYGGDRDCPAWGEPSGDDFLSPALIEAECMRRLFGEERFGPWFERFLPRLATGQPEALFDPTIPTDRTDGKIAHLDGLNLSRAWCYRSLAAALPEADARRRVMLDAAEAHLTASLPHLEGDYMGEHWLASFALLAMDEVNLARRAARPA